MSQYWSPTYVGNLMPAHYSPQDWKHEGPLAIDQSGPFFWKRSCEKMADLFTQVPAIQEFITSTPVFAVNRDGEHPNSYAPRLSYATTGALECFKISIRFSCSQVERVLAHEMGHLLRQEYRVRCGDEVFHELVACVRSSSLPQRVWDFSYDDPSFARYLLSDSEIIADMFVQWLAITFGDAKLLGQINSQIYKGRYLLWDERSLEIMLEQAEDIFHESFQRSLSAANV